MGSAHSIEDVQAIEALGGRAFLIVPIGTTKEDLKVMEKRGRLNRLLKFCPQPQNVGVVTCSTCGLCDGVKSDDDKRPHEVIHEH